MCGIIGYIGNEDSVNLLLSGLESLEYRGYDSAGVALISNGVLSIKKAQGRLSCLRDKLSDYSAFSKLGIGHTRWATHGVPSELNSHPHTNEKETIAVVHNGIIENYAAIKDYLISKGYTFKSETDTEVIPHLLDMYYDGDILSALKKTVKMLEGSYALGVISSLEPDKIVAVKKDSPLIVGLHPNGNFIASDITAIISRTRNVYFLDDNEFVTLSKNGVSVTDETGKEINKTITQIDFSNEASQKDGYDHFMIKEIHEQPEAIRNTLRGRLDKSLKLNLDNINFDKSIEKLYIVACGTAYHAGLIGKKLIESLAKIPCEVCLASEFRYDNPIITDRTAVIVVSQSGETADTLAALRMVKKHGNTVYAITNVLGSSISREADYVFYTYAGPEISVASTKAYTTQLMAFCLFASYLGELKNTVTKEELDEFKRLLLKVPEILSDSIKLENEVKPLAKMISEKDDVYFLGRGLDYFVAMEASLKLKEISYIHSDAYASGELKHGPIALIENDTIVISVCTNPEISNKLNSNVKEVIARGAKTVGFTSCLSDVSAFDTYIELPKVTPLLSPFAAIIPLQFLAYYVCIEKGLDVDKPRNLAKSVTVE